MPVVPVLFLVFLAVPLAEIYLLIQIGGVIGAGWTITLVVGTALLGAFLVRAQGVSTIRRVQQNMERGQLPAMELLEGLALLVAGALLLTPGFFTDAVGFLLLTPPVRRAVIGFGLRHGRVTTIHTDEAGPAGAARPERTLDGEFRELDD
jgi:UPF0716 protein FxsA